MAAPLTDFYSRVASASLKKESVANTAVIPDKFFEFNEENLTIMFDHQPSQPVASNRALKIRPVIKAIPAPAGTIKMNVEPKQLGHFLNGLMGGITGGRYLPMGAVTGTFQVGETVTQSTSSATGVIAAISDANVLILTGVTGTFDTTHLVTGGTSSATATPTAFDTSVYAYYGKLPQNSLTTYSLQMNLMDMAIRYTGVRFQSLDSLAQANNIITAGFKVFAQGAFRQARVTAITTAGSTKTITVDDTTGLVSTDSCKLYRPGTGFVDFGGSGVKTAAITVVSSTTFTVATLQADTAVGDLILLAPQTPTYTVGNNFAWIGGSTASIGATIATLATAAIEDFTLVIENDFEDRHAASGILPSNRFPTALIQKGLQCKGSFKTWHQNEEFMQKTRETTAQALRILSKGNVIGSTTIYNQLQFTFPSVFFNPFQTNVQNDAIVEDSVNFDAYYDSTTGSEVEVLYVTDVTSF